MVDATLTCESARYTVSSVSMPGVSSANSVANTPSAHI